MHNLVKFFLAALVCSVCISCSLSGDTIQSSTKNISQECDTYTINGEILSFKGTSEGINTLNASIEEEINGWIEDFKGKIPENTNSSGTLPCLQMRHIIKMNTPTFVSFITEKYVYITGLHGNNWRQARNFDVVQDKEVRLSDLFNDSSYPKILNQRMKELIDSDNEAYHDLWEIPTIDKNRENRFYMDGKNLVIFYEPYELSYYARGVVEFPIPLEKIRGYIKSEYLFK